MLCRHCGRMRLLIGEDRAWCYAFRQEVRLRRACVFFVDLDLHPQPDVLSAVIESVAWAKRLGEARTAEEIRTVAAEAARRAMTCRAIKGASAPGIVKVYVDAVTGGKDG